MRAICRVVCITLVTAAGSSVTAEESIEKTPYPSVIALSQEVPGHWVYKSFPKLLPLYFFEGEPSGRSTCDQTCTAVWPIVAASEDDRPLGYWTVIKRDDGRLQWAFRNKAVYTYFEDSPGHSRGAGKNQDWYLEKGAYEYLLKAGVPMPLPPVQNKRKVGDHPKRVARYLQP